MPSGEKYSLEKIPSLLRAPTAQLVMSAVDHGKIIIESGKVEPSGRLVPAYRHPGHPGTPSADDWRSRFTQGSFSERAEVIRLFTQHQRGQLPLSEAAYFVHNAAVYVFASAAVSAAEAQLFGFFADCHFPPTRRLAARHIVGRLVSVGMLDVELDLVFGDQQSKPLAENKEVISLTEVEMWIANLQGAQGRPEELVLERTAPAG